MIKDKILTAHPHASATQYDYREIYVADFSQRTHGTRSVEVSSSPQACPISGGLMDSAIFHNQNSLKVEFVKYHDHCFFDQSGNIIKHCEGSMFPANENNVKWIVMLELKDCAPKNILNHAFKARRQIYNVAKDLRSRKIITNEKVFGIFSCPQAHTSYNDTIFGDPIQQTRLKRYTGITYAGTNEVYIIDKNACNPIR